MDENVKTCLGNLGSTDDKVRYEVLQTILKITEDRVGWIYEAWEDLLQKLNDENSYQRSIGIMVLCNLAKSDTENRLGACLDLLLAHTKDEKFITSRQCIQNIWKVAVPREENRKRVVDHLEMRFRECSGENHYNLIRQDIIHSMRLLYEAEKDEALLAKARELVSEEKDDKYRKKYEAVLKLK